MTTIPFKPLEGLSESLGRDGRVRYLREDGFTEGARPWYVWRIYLDRAATKEEKRWLHARGASYFPGCWTIIDEAASEETPSPPPDGR